MGLSGAVSAQQFPGGFLEQPSTAQPRATLTQSQIEALLPARGAFTFPAPYNTVGVRLTNESDCSGADCVNYVGYSYWNNINNHVGQDTMLIFVGMDRNRGGQGPSLIEYNKVTDEVVNLGPLFSAENGLSWATGEGWYFSATQPNSLYITSGPSLQRFDVVTKATETVFNVTDHMGSGYYVNQIHSSANDMVHSATVKSSANYASLGCMVYSEQSAEFTFFASQGSYDECQIDKSGQWLLIKEDIDGLDGEDNRIINLQTGEEKILLDRDGAAGHSDMGHGYMIAADNYANDANSTKLWKFSDAPLQGTLVYHNADWGVSTPAHVSHSNAKPGIAAEEQYSCGSSVNYNNSAEANEIICFGHDGTDQALVVAPVMTDLNAAGGGNNYAKSPKGNVDVTGQYFIWTSNMGGNRLDAFLVKVPSHLLNSTGSETPAPEPEPTPEPSPEPSPEPTPEPAPEPASTTWSEWVNATLVGSTLTKTEGCDGCEDAGAVSAEQILEGDGYLEFTVQDTQKMRYIGLSLSQAGTSASQMDFAVSLQAGYAEVRENGAYRSDTGINSGDVIRIAVTDGVVTYSVNGAVFYTSAAAPTYPMNAYTSLMAMGSSVSDAVVVDIASDTGESADTGTGGETTPAPTALGNPVSVAWEQMVNVSVIGKTLIKNEGCDGCDDAGAASTQVANSGDVYLEFKVMDNEKLQYVGLSSDSLSNTAGTINFGLALQSGIVEVRENGSYRSDAPIDCGDVLRVSVSGGEVSYSINGSVFYVSNDVPVYPLRAYSRMLSTDSIIRNAKIATSN